MQICSFARGDMDLMTAVQNKVKELFEVVDYSFDGDTTAIYFVANGPRVGAGTGRAIYVANVIVFGNKVTLQIVSEREGPKSRGCPEHLLTLVKEDPFPSEWTELERQRAAQWRAGCLTPA